MKVNPVVARGSRGGDSVLAELIRSSMMAQTFAKSRITRSEFDALSAKDKAEAARRARAGELSLVDDTPTVPPTPALDSSFVRRLKKYSAIGGWGGNGLGARARVVFLNDWSGPFVQIGPELTPGDLCTVCGHAIEWIHFECEPEESSCVCNACRFWADAQLARDFDELDEVVKEATALLGPEKPGQVSGAGG